MTSDGKRDNVYDERYAGQDYYWTTRPSKTCIRALELMPPDRPLRLLDVGCGEGRNAVFFARNGYRVTAFDLSPQGVDKTQRMAAEAGVAVNAFEADLNDYRLGEPFDIIFSTGVLQYVPPELRADVLGDYKQHTAPGGLNVLSVFVRKPFIARGPDGESAAHKWVSGELLGHYHDWRIEYSAEEVFDCNSGGAPHQHAVNRIIARRPAPEELVRD